MGSGAHPIKSRPGKAVGLHDIRGMTFPKYPPPFLYRIIGQTPSESITMQAHRYYKPHRQSPEWPRRVSIPPFFRVQVYVCHYMQNANCCDGVVLEKSASRETLLGEDQILNSCRIIGVELKIVQSAHCQYDEY